MNIICNDTNEIVIKDARFFESYRKTEHFRKMEEKYLTPTSVCLVCGSHKGLTLMHSKVPKRLGCEKVQDVAPICESCRTNEQSLSAFFGKLTKIQKAISGRNPKNQWQGEDWRKAKDCKDEWQITAHDISRLRKFNLSRDEAIQILRVVVQKKCRACNVSVKSKVVERYMKNAVKKIPFLSQFEVKGYNKDKANRIAKLIRSDWDF